jgi:uncharacterized protein YtpQ (UPF0354 family)
MFGFGKKKKQSTEPTKSNIVPRIRHKGFIDGIKAAGVPDDQLPVIEPFVDDMVVTYAFDLPGIIQMVSPGNLADLGLRPQGLRKVALENMVRDKQIGVEEIDPVFRIVMGDNLEATSLLARGFWNDVEKELSGDLVMTVPSRDVVYFCDSATDEAVWLMNDMAGQTREQEEGEVLSDKLFIWKNEKWEVYDWEPDA